MAFLTTARACLFAIVVCMSILSGAGSTGPQPVSRQNAEHYTWGDHCDGWYLTKQSNLHVIEERLPPGAGETLHLHHHALQLFYVLDGAARFTVDGKVIEVPRGASLTVPPGSWHRVENPGRTDLSLLVTSQPPSHGDRVEAAPADKKRP